MSISRPGNHGAARVLPGRGDPAGPGIVGHVQQHARPGPRHSAPQCPLPAPRPARLRPGAAGVEMTTSAAATAAAAPARGSTRTGRPTAAAAARASAARPTSRTNTSAEARAQFLQRGDGSRCGPAAAEDDGGGCGGRARVPERVDDAGDVGVVRDQPGRDQHCRRRISKATVLTTPSARATPRTSSTSATMADLSGMVTESPRQPPSAALVPDLRA